MAWYCDSSYRGIFQVPPNKPLAISFSANIDKLYLTE